MDRTTRDRFERDVRQAETWANRADLHGFRLEAAHARAQIVMARRKAYEEGMVIDATVMVNRVETLMGALVLGARKR